MYRIVVAGSTLRAGWTGGEPLLAGTLGKGLSSLGYEVLTWSVPRRGLALAALATSPIDWDVVSVGRYQRLLREWRPDVVLGFYDYDSSLCRAATLLDIPYVACVHIYWPVCPIGVLYINGSGACSGSALGKCLRHMGREIPDSRLPLGLKRLPVPLGLAVYSKYSTRHTFLTRADAIVVPSQRMATILANAGLGRIHVVPDAVSTEELSFIPWSGGPKEILLPSASSSERKGLGYFIEVAKRVKVAHPETRFVATNFSGNAWVEGTAFLSREDLLVRLQRSYAIAAPALWEEPFGLTIIEAMATGRPVVAFDSGAASEIIVNGETGFVVPRGDTSALSSAIDRLLSDEHLALRMGRAGRARVVERYSVPRMVAGYVGVIDTIAGS